jgi:hypothetical protein
LTRLYVAGRRGLVAEDPAPTSLLARRLVRHHTHDPAPYTARWAAVQQAEDDANLTAWLQDHPEAAGPTTTTTRQAADTDQDAGPSTGEDRSGRDWCPSWADDDAGYADAWTDEDEALAVAEAEALWARDLVEQAQRTAPACAAPTRAAQLGLVDSEARPEGWRRRRLRWWFHLSWWVAIALLMVGAYRLVR